MRNAFNPKAIAAGLTELWSPRVVGEVDDHYVKVARIHGDLEWHSHADEDELFFVLQGRLRLEFEDGAVDIDLNVMHGGVKITLPRNAVVDFDGVHTEWKDTRYKPARNPTGNGPRVRLTGVIGFGRLKLRHARR